MTVILTGNYGWHFKIYWDLFLNKDFFLNRKRLPWYDRIATNNSNNTEYNNNKNVETKMLLDPTNVIWRKKKKTLNKMEGGVEWTMHYWQEQINESHNCQDHGAFVSCWLVCVLHLIQPDIVNLLTPSVGQAWSNLQLQQCHLSTFSYLTYFFISLQQ